MKKILFILSLPLVLFITSCEETPEEDPMKGLEEIDLVIFDDSLKIFVPNTLEGTLRVRENNNGATEVIIGNGFQLYIEQLDGEVEMVKADIAGDDVFQLQQYVIDEPNLLFWETKAPDMQESTFHFYAVVTVNGLPYVIADIKNGEQHTKGIVQIMVDAAKTLQAKSAPAKEELPST